METLPPADVIWLTINKIRLIDFRKSLSVRVSDRIFRSFLNFKPGKKNALEAVILQVVTPGSIKFSL